MTTAKPILKDGAIYFADNGRMICSKCAGATALYSGRDISGQKVERVTMDDAAYLRSALHRSAVSCETGCTTVASIAGPDGFPAEMNRIDEHTIEIEVAS